MEKEVYIRILDEVTNYDAFCINFFYENDSANTTKTHDRVKW